MGLPIALGLLGTVGQFAQASAASSAARAQAAAQAQAARMSAAINQQNAVIAERNANLQAARRRRENQQLLGRQKALFGASGLNPEGSMLDLLEDDAAALELDALFIEYEGQLQKRGFLQNVQLDNLRADNALRAGEARARAARTGGLLSGATGLIRTFGSGFSSGGGVAPSSGSGLSAGFGGGAGSGVAPTLLGPGLRLA